MHCMREPPPSTKERCRSSHDSGCASVQTVRMSSTRPIDSSGDQQMRDLPICHNLKQNDCPVWIIAGKTAWVLCFVLPSSAFRSRGGRDGADLSRKSRAGLPLAQRRNGEGQLPAALPA